MTEEQKAASESRKDAARKARGNNGARRREYFTIETKEEDVCPDGMDASQ